MAQFFLAPYSMGCLLLIPCSYIHMGVLLLLGTATVPTTSAVPLGVLPTPAAITSVALTVPSSASGSTLPQVQAVVTRTSQAQSQTRGVILSPALQPIPARLVRRIRSNEFIEMRDLLTDNIALHEQLEAIHGPLLNVATPGALRPRLREVPSLISWVFCFVAYIAVQTEDEATRDMLAYCRLIIREGLRHGGQGWQEYDRGFRAQAAIDQSLRWNVLLPDLQAATTLGQRAGGGSYCHLCRGVDHTASLCALGFMQQPLTSPMVPAVSTAADSGRRPSRARPRPVCTSWNSGRCIYPGTCNFRHVCATCSQRHQARECRDTPAESPYRRGTVVAPAPATPSPRGQ